MTTIAEIEVQAKMDTRDVEGGIESIKRKTTDWGNSTTESMRKMRETFQPLRQSYRDLMMTIGMVTGVVGVAMVAVNALGGTFEEAAKKAEDAFKKTKARIEEIKNALEDLRGEGTDYEKQAEIIKAKYAPESKEYKNAMLDLQERMAAEAYTKYGQISALGEITGIEAQRARLGEKPLTVQEQFERGYPQRPFQDTYEYGLSPAYQYAVTKGYGGFLKAVQPSPEAPIPTKLYQRAGVGTAPATMTVNMNIVINSNEDPEKVFMDIGAGLAMGLNQSNIKTAIH